MSGEYCVIGGAGFVGQRTIGRVTRTGNAPVRALVHRRPVDGAVETVTGDARDRASLEKLLTPGSTVLNFAYGDDAENFSAVLGEASANRGVRRVVHVSTCSVYGTVRALSVDEDTPCTPAGSYERSKYEAEAALVKAASSRFELAILRPTAVFGARGRNLESLALRVLNKPWPARYVRACAMGHRRMHAVDVETVAAAVLFLATTPLPRGPERFIVSQDDEPANNYASIEAFFVRRFGATPYPVPPVPLPERVLRFGLWMSGRSNIEPRRTYASAKLGQAGFVAPRSFEKALDEYAAWIAAIHRRDA